LKIYGFDISNVDKNRPDIAFHRWKAMRKFAALVRSIRNRYPEFDFHIVEDEKNRQRHYVHIMDGVNEDLLLKEIRRAEKTAQTKQRIMEKQKRIVGLDPEEKDIQYWLLIIARSITSKLCVLMVQRR
jgi:hypothetical protein